jgi:putative endonuclease
MYTVYILYSQKSSRYYVGQTTDITDRFERYNQGRSKSTKFGIPWSIVLQQEVSSRSEAMILEKKIKKRGAKRYIEDQLGV